MDDMTTYCSKLISKQNPELWMQMIDEFCGPSSDREIKSVLQINAKDVQVSSSITADNRHHYFDV